MLTKRIIPCLDIKDGKTVKGVNFENLRVAGDAVELADRYTREGADELVLLDITATIENRGTVLDLVRRVATTINIPFTIGGGIRTIQDVSALLQAGADKISINSAAVKNPELITTLAQEFGSQCVVVAVDVRQQRPPDNNGKWEVVINAGTQSTGLEAFEWAKEIEARGGGEILLTSMDHDGTKAGFALDITRQIAQNVSLPVIASGGAGSAVHFADVLRCNDSGGCADAALAASLFHFGELSLYDLKTFLSEHQIPVRI